MVIHFKTFKDKKYNIKEISNLEKVTNVLFSNKRKKINKNIKKLLSLNYISKIKELNLDLRPENIEPKIYYKITELFEKK
jgi:16S rRNA A1518/A1519 N6-dimethyltransferase RsmA/KsgA/DIM1 with predicted DNA glycosylase/AP lyase activity